MGALARAFVNRGARALLQGGTWAATKDGAAWAAEHTHGDIPPPPNYDPSLSLGGHLIALLGWRTSSKKFCDPLYR